MVDDLLNEVVDFYSLWEMNSSFFYLSRLKNYNGTEAT